MKKGLEVKIFKPFLFACIFVCAYNKAAQKKTSNFYVTGLHKPKKLSNVYNLMRREPAPKASPVFHLVVHYDWLQCYSIPTCPMLPAPPL